MTVLVPKAGEPGKKENVDVESVVTESEEVGIKIPSSNDEKIPSEEQDENSSNINVRVEKIKKRRIIILLLGWFLTLTMNKIIIEAVSPALYRVGRMELSAVQVLMITFGSWLYLAMSKKGKEQDQLEISWLYYWRFIIPIAISMFARRAADTWVIWPSPMGETLTVTIEAFLPFFILAASNIILEHNISWMRIVPLGVLASLFYGYYWRMNPLRVQFTEAVAFAFLIALEMVFAKKVMQEKHMHPLRLLTHLGSIFLLLLIPVVIFDFFQYSDFRSLMYSLSPDLLSIYIIYGVVCCIQTAVTFVLLSMVTPFEFSAVSFSTHLSSSLLLIPVYHYILRVWGKNLYFEESF